MLTVFRDIFAKYAGGFQESIIRAAGYLSELEDKQKGTDYFEMLMRYIFSARQDLTKENITEIIEIIEIIEKIKK